MLLRFSILRNIGPQQMLIIERCLHKCCQRSIPARPRPPDPTCAIWHPMQKPGGPPRIGSPGNKPRQPALKHPFRLNPDDDACSFSMNFGDVRRPSYPVHTRLQVADPPIQSHSVPQDLFQCCCRCCSMRLFRCPLASSYKHPPSSSESVAACIASCFHARCSLSDSHCHVGLLV